MRGRRRFQYQLLHVCGFRPAQHRWFYFGHAVHRALELLHRWVLAGQHVHGSVAAAVWAEAWRPPESWTKGRARKIQDTGLLYLQRYVGHHADRFARILW